MVVEGMWDGVARGRLSDKVPFHQSTEQGKTKLCFKTNLYLAHINTHFCQIKRKPLLGIKFAQWNQLIFMAILYCQVLLFLFLLLFKYSCLHFPPHSPLPQPYPPPLVLSMCPLQLFLKTLPPFPRIIHSHLPSGYCQFVLNFNVSGYILLACLFCWLCSNYKWDHMVFLFHHLAYFT